MTNLSRKAQQAVRKYGTKTCLDAYRHHRKDGEGAFTVGLLLGLTTRQADAAIDAGREVAQAASFVFAFFTQEDGWKSMTIDGLDALEHLERTNQGCYTAPRLERLFTLAYQKVQPLINHKILASRIVGGYDRSC